MMNLSDVAVVPAVLRQLGLGVVYWLVFLLVLEPGNVLWALSAGGGLSWSQEILRIFAATLLGASGAPVLFALVDHLPVQANCWRRRSAIHIGNCVLSSAVLIAISCVLADGLLASEHRPVLAAFRAEFASNWVLLSFALAVLTAIAHALHFFRQIKGHERATAPKENTDAFLKRIAIRSRREVKIIELDTVDWIEAQGNYLALHVGRASHLIRESLTCLEARLDPTHFVRIHRGTIVATDRIRDLTSLGAGDACIRLKDGTELRLSRYFRERLFSAIRPNFARNSDHTF